MEINETFTVFNVVRIFTVATVAFFAALLITPLWTKFLYKYKLGKQVIRTEDAPIFSEMHKKKVGTPTMGGVIIWATVVVLAIVFWVLAKWYPDSLISKLDFLSRSQTWVPLGALIVGAIFGFIDDLFGILRIGPGGGGLKMRIGFHMSSHVGTALGVDLLQKLSELKISLDFFLYVDDEQQNSYVERKLRLEEKIRTILHKYDPSGIIDKSAPLMELHHDPYQDLFDLIPLFIKAYASNEELIEELKDELGYFTRTNTPKLKEFRDYETMASELSELEW